MTLTSNFDEAWCYKTENIFLCWDFLFIYLVLKIVKKNIKHPLVDCALIHFKESVYNLNKMVKINQIKFIIY